MILVLTVNVSNNQASETWNHQLGQVVVSVPYSIYS